MNCPRCGKELEDKGITYYCKDCNIVVVNDNVSPSTMQIRIHLGTISMPLCYPPDKPAEIVLETGNKKYTYRLV